MHHEDMGGKRHDEFHVVLDDEKNDLPLGEDAQQKIAQHVEQSRIDTGRRLIEQQQPGPRDQAGDDFEKPPLSVGQIAGRFVLQSPQTDKFKQILGLGQNRAACVPVPAESLEPFAAQMFVLGGEQDVVETGFLFEDTAFLKRAGDSEPCPPMHAQPVDARAGKTNSA